MVDRKQWAANVQEREPELAATLKLFREIFQAKVMHMETHDTETSWSEERAIPSGFVRIVPVANFDENRTYSSGFKPKKKRRQDD